MEPALLSVNCSETGEQSRYPDAFRRGGTLEDDDLRVAVESWQDSLLQLDARNKLLYFDAKSVSFVPIDTQSISAFVSALERARHGLVFAFQPAVAHGARSHFATSVQSTGHSTPSQAAQAAVQTGDIQTQIAVGALQSRLLKLRNKDREMREEQGLSVLFLACGLLHWVDENDVAATSPLLLMPCTLERASPRDPFVLRKGEEDFLANVTLEHKLATDLHFTLPSYEMDSSPEDYLRSVESQLAGKPGWSVSSEVFLGTFQYSKMAMWEDLQDLRTKDALEHPLVRFLAGDISVTSTIPVPHDPWYFREEHALAGGLLDDLVQPQSLPLVMPADFSQLQAIGAALTTENLVIHGPPGTGKSQTIANLIGAFIASGRTVLFVSEKKAALDVVKRRLNERGLGIFCLDLHSERAKKQHVYAQFVESLAASRGGASADFDYASLLDRRARLNRYVRELHKRRQPLGLSAFQVSGSVARVRHLPDVAFQVPHVEQLTTAEMDRFLELAGRLKARPDEFNHHFDSPWRTLTELTPSVGLAADVRRRITGLSNQIAAARARADEVAGWLGHEAPRSVEEMLALQATLATMALCPSIEPTWLDAETQDGLHPVIEEQRRAQVDRRNLLSDYGRSFAVDYAALPHLEALDSLARTTFADATTVERWLGGAWQSRALLERQALEVALTALPGAIERTQTMVGRIQVALGIRTDGSRGDVTALLDLCRRLVNLDTVPEAWLASGALERIGQVLAEGKRRCEELADLEAKLFSEFDHAILAQVDRGMLERFRADYGSGIKRLLNGQYKADMRTLRMNHLGSSNLNHEEARQVLETISQLQAAAATWERDAPVFQQWLASWYHERATDWDALTGKAHLLGDLLAMLSFNGAARVVLLDRAALASLHQASSLLKESFDSLENTEAVLLPKDLPSPIGVRRHIDSSSGAPGDLLEDFQRVDDLLLRLEGLFVAEPSDWGVLRRSIRAGARLEASEHEQDKVAPLMRARFGRRYQGWQTDWQDVESALKWSETVSKTLGAKSEVFISHACEPRPAGEYDGCRLQIESAGRAILAAAEDLQKLLGIAIPGWENWTLAPLDAVGSWLTERATNADGANDWLIYRKACQDLDTLAGAGTVDRIRASTSTAEDVPDIVRRHIYEAWLDDRASAIPELGDFTGADHEVVLQQFRQLDRSLADAARDVIRSKAFTAYPTTQSPTRVGEYGTLRDQISRRRGQLPVRSLLRRIPAMAKALKPCFMMSPLAVSQYLPRPNSGPLFDVVIFDEASQVFPEDAVPAIWRASQAIVVGDNKQLPPTSFFRRLGDDGMGDDRDEEEEEEAQNGLAGRESILDAMLGKAIGTVSREAYLNVHYRSRHEDLIKFSNRSFYDDRLHVYPSALRDRSNLGVRDEYVADGVYESRQNRKEAERVVDIVFELLRSRPLDESIGVVALSKTQADLIQELINQRRIEEPDMEARLTESGTEPFFVKNLENVQGDERDHILLCIGYGPNAQKQVYQRFGPIASDTGWRRLNVAVSRARRSLTVIHSLRPEQITAEGAAWLKSFLEFVRQPDVWIGRRGVAMGSGGEPESDFEAAVRSALVARGHNVHSQVGSAGFSIDLAIASADGKRYDLGIECDGAAYHSGPAARDRDWLRQSILEGLGWCIHRVWSTDWLRNPEREVLAIEAALNRCQQRRESGAEHEPPPRPVQELDDDDAEYQPLDIDAILETEVQPLFDEYRVADLHGLRRGPELRYETESNLAPMILQIALVESPVHMELVVQRLRDHYGMGRAGSPTSDHVMDVARRLAERNQVDLDKDYLRWPDSGVNPRRPGLQPRRDIRHIAHDELCEGLVRVADQIKSAGREDLLGETSRQFGFDRLGQDIRAALESAVSEHIATGQLTLDDEGNLRCNAVTEAPRVSVAAVTTKQAGEDAPGAPVMKDLLDWANSAGIEVIDRTSSGGSLWLVGGEELRPILEPRGFAQARGRSTSGRPGWYFKPTGA